MRYETIRYEAEDGVVTITLARPDHLNAMNAQMRADLTHALKRAHEDGRAVVLTGMGTAFCAGQDIGDGTGDLTEIDLGRVLREEYGPMLAALTACPVPVIAAVNGMAAGGGANLALAADVCLAGEGARFLQAFARIGLIPDLGGTYLLPRLAGRARAMGMSLFAEPVTARQALDWGMIWEVTSDADLQAVARRRAETLAKGATEAFRRTREAFQASASASWEEQLETEARLQAQAGRSRDFQEGVVAFREKRPPKFEGR
jgi:2-(1,2-epoxy-1,2-dihydrophenyl)acetyl-CoA isomerase